MKPAPPVMRTLSNASDAPRYHLTVRPTHVDHQQLLLLHCSRRRSTRARARNGVNLDAFSFYVDASPLSAALSLTVLLARHGTHDEVGRVLSGRSDIALNAVGRSQAERLASRLASVRLTKLYSSPRRRARETAAIFADRLDLDVTLVDELDEIDFGAWAGQSFSRLDEDPAWRRWNVARGSAATPGGETMESVTARALRHLEACGDQGTILCVSHCDVIRGLVAHVLGLNADRLLAFDVDPASVSTIELGYGLGRVVAVNERVS